MKRRMGRIGKWEENGCRKGRKSEERRVKRGRIRKKMKKRGNVKMRKKMCEEKNDKNRVGKTKRNG